MRAQGLNLWSLWFSYIVLKYKEKVELIFGCSSTSSDSGRRQIFLTCSIKLRQWSTLSRRDITLWYLSKELFYHENYISIEYGQLWLFLFTIKKEISTQGKKLHAIPHFPTGSFVVQTGDHLQFRNFCSPIWGSFLVWGTFAVGDHLHWSTLFSNFLTSCFWKGCMQIHLII